MEIIQETKYKCGICGHTYDNKEDAESCEAKPIAYDKGVKIGDKIRIVTGQGQGMATVTRVFIFDKYWGHYAWERYWHTVAVDAKCDGSWGSRQLTFDDYVPVK
jgi:hypothetical protein